MHYFVYNLLLCLILPFVPLKLLWRGIKQPEYIQHWSERFGFFNQSVSKPIICVHCVSVGETHAAAPLIKSLLNTFPNHQVLITHGTPTGRATSEQLFGDQVLRTYLPYDLPFSVKRFLNHFQPTMMIFMETEIWFNLIKHCHQQAIPAVLINARLSEKSAKGYEKVRPLMANALAQLLAVSTQTEADAKRFERFGIRPTVNGNLKFDVDISADKLTQGQHLKQQIGQRPVFIAASTREGEERLIIQTIKSLREEGIFTILVPRHPQRFEEVATLLLEEGLSFKRKSELKSGEKVSQSILLGDTMGEMTTYYAAADVAFIGGSLLPLGGQNMIESCAVGTPVLLGPHTFNFELIANQVIDAGAGVRVQDAEALTYEAMQLLSKEANETLKGMQLKAKQFVAQHQGATSKYLTLITPYILTTPQ